MKTGKELAIEYFGGVGEVAKICGITSQAVSQWSSISIHNMKHLLKKSKELVDSGRKDYVLSAQLLDPDLFVELDQAVA